MVIVKNIIVNEFNLINELSNKKNFELQKCIKLLDEADINAADILPRKSEYTVEFELMQTNVDIANGIRRCLMNEMEVISFDFDEYTDLNTSDTSILCDYIKKQIELVPINQDYDYEGLTISLKKENLSDEVIDVLTDDITILKKNGKKVPVDSITGTNIVLCSLHPNDYIIINNIHTCVGNGIENAGKFSLLSNITYRIVDVDPIVETRLGQTGVSSMLSNPTHFFISYSTHRNIEKPLDLIPKCCDVLVDRLEKIKLDMKNISNKDTTYFSQLLTLETIGNIKKIQIKGEYWTLINIICRYCYILTKHNIKFITPSLIHPEKEIGVISITHTEFSTLIQDAITASIKDLNTVKGYFE